MMLRVRDYTKLGVWQKAHELVLATYRATANFPVHETYGLSSQMRRAAASIPTNIAEGCGRDGDAELARFVQIALGSASELEYRCRLGRDLGYIDNEEYEIAAAAVVEVKRMLSGLLNRLRADA
jgi:four helix bundle protein